MNPHRSEELLLNSIEVWPQQQTKQDLFPAPLGTAVLQGDLKGPSPSSASSVAPPAGKSILILMEFISWALSNSNEFSKTLLAPCIVSLAAACYDNEGTAPTLDVQQICPSNSYLQCVLFSLSQLKPFMILFHMDLKLSYKLRESCNMHCSRQMLVYLYYGKLFHTQNILQISKCT